MVCIYRNPKDTAVSYYHHTKNMPWHYGFEGDWNDYFPFVLSGLHQEGKWVDNVISWWKNGKNNPNILFIRYEQMKKDFVGSAKRLAAFLGKSYDDDYYNRLQYSCSFDSMRKLSGLHFGAFDPVRKGEIGDWKNYFTVAQSEQYEALYQPVLDQHKDFIIEYE
ncbi:unnamed protein product [Owenia fusiformis]|uniref:Sulfotransferase domain-containing protein n=1 Tax=Owenia fusiformis TaxID=6347 RepID=A0A8S4Q3P9_OWEFU|nr:unnamed protein product [Owenia fusiformis]